MTPEEAALKKEKDRAEGKLVTGELHITVKMSDLIKILQQRKPKNDREAV